MLASASRVATALKLELIGRPRQFVEHQCYVMLKFVHSHLLRSPRRSPGTSEPLPGCAGVREQSRDDAQAGVDRPAQAVR